MLIPSLVIEALTVMPSLSRRVNANSQPVSAALMEEDKLIKKGEC